MKNLPTKWIPLPPTLSPLPWTNEQENYRNRRHEPRVSTAGRLDGSSGFKRCHRQSWLSGPRSLAWLPVCGQWPGPASTWCQWTRWLGWNLSQIHSQSSQRERCDGNCGSLHLGEKWALKLTTHHLSAWIFYSLIYWGSTMCRALCQTL